MTAAAEKLAPKGTPKTTPNAARAAAGLPPYEEPPKHPNLAAALAAFQAEVPNVRKGQTANVASQKGSVLVRLRGPLRRDRGHPPPPRKARPRLLSHADTGRARVPPRVRAHPRVGRSPRREVPAPGRGDAAPAARVGDHLRTPATSSTAITGVAPGGDDDDAQATQAYQNQPQQAPRQQAPSAQAAPEPRNWAAKAEQDYAAGAPASHLAGLWQAAKQDGAPLEHLDRIASLGRARQAESEPTDAEPAAEETPEDAPAGEKAHA